MHTIPTAFTGYRLKQFEPPDWATLKQIRLEALQKDPSVFGSSYASECQLPDTSWQERLQSASRAYFGIFLPDGTCIGLSAVAGKDGIAILIASYIRVEHRGKGLAARLFSARINWARINRYPKVTVSHRADNAPSQAAILRAGFAFTHIETHLWPDGLPADEYFYELTL